MSRTKSDWTLIGTILSLLLGTSFTSNGQILISLIFGDKLNSENIEFGLDGGYSINSLTGFSEGSPAYTVNLGMYFDFKVSEHWFIHTGVIIRSKNGIRNLPAYSVGVPEFDAFLEDATLARELKYFYVPGLLRYKFTNHMFLEAGPQFGLLAKAEDHLELDLNNGSDKLQYERNLTSDYNRIDAGITVGTGIKLRHGTGITTGIRYYFGLTNTLKDASIYQANRIGYVYVSIPIGRHKSSTNTEEE